jgi:hypothetical protein
MAPAHGKLFFSRFLVSRELFLSESNQRPKSSVHQIRLTAVFFARRRPLIPAGKTGLQSFRGCRVRAKNSARAFNAALSAVYGELSFALVTRRGKIMRRQTFLKYECESNI